MGHVIQLQAQATTPDFGYADAGLIAVNHFAKLSNSNAELSLADSNSFGASVTNLGDLDGAGAGVTTIAVGTRNDNTGGFFRGAVYLVNINASGTIEGAPVKIAHGSSGISLRNGDGFGASVANLGDLDIGLSGTNATNSLVTIAVGVPGADIGSSAFTDEGAIYLINLNSSGIVGTPVKVTSNTTGITISNSANFGRSIANLGDLDGSGNGVVTLVAGLTGLEEGQQVSIINLNSAGAVVGNQLKYNQGYLGISLHNQDNFGTSIESLGDLDIGLSGTDATNSVLTIAIGAPEEVLTAVTGPESITPYPNNGGSIYLLNLDASGSKVGDVIKIGKDTPGLNANHAEGFGASILNLSDLDGTGDGVVTLAVASLGIGAIKIINLDETGAIVGPVGTIRDGNISETISMFDGFGQSMVNIGDINGDGIDEIAVGTSNFDAGKGSVNIISFASKAYGLTTSDAVNIFLPIAETGEPAPAYALSPTSLPTGLTFNETARTITGTPTQDTAGKDYTLTATNSSGTDTFSFRLGVGNLAPALSSDNDLSDLALSSHTSGGLASAIGTNYHPAIITALTLQPAFSSSTTAYTISETLAVGVQAAIIFPTTSSSRATITVDGKDAASGIGSPQVILNGGDNIISVVVTAEDGTSKEYTITAAKTRPPLEINEISDGYINNAEDESDITISGTSTGIADTETITVTFSDSNITTKTATVTNNAWETTIPSAEIKAAAEGTITVTATHTGTSTTATQTFKYDITPPTLASPIPDQEATVGRDFFLLFRGHSIFTNASEFVSTGESNGIIFTGPAWSGTGSSLVPGIVTITITAFDAAGNSVSDEFTITILTSSAPTIDSFSLTAGNAYIKTETLTFTNQENDESLTAVWFPSGENNCNETSYNAQVTSQVSGVKPTGNGIPITLSGTIADNSAGRTGDITYFVRAADSASDWNNRYVCAAVTDGRIVVTQRSDNRFELSKNRRPVVAFDPSAADTSDKQTFDLTINVTDSNADQTVTAKYKVIDSSDTCDATTTDTGATDITTAIGSTNGKTVTLTFNSEDDNGKKVCVNAEDHSGIPRDAAFSDTPGGIASFARPRASPTITGIDTTAPVLAATIDDQTATVGTDFTFTIPANTFTDSGTLTYTSSALTNGITFATDTWSGVGSGLTAGTVTITVTATDAAGNTATDEFDIVIAAAPLTTWTGTTDSNWATATNWTDGVPTATHNVLIPTTANQPIISAGTGVTVHEGVINPGATLSMSSGASLIANATFSGNVIYNREINFVSGSLAGWYLMASPVAGQTYNDAYITANDIAQGTGTNISSRGIGTYNTLRNDWSYYQSGGLTGTFVSGQGYTIKKHSTTGAISFTGTLNVDDAGVNVLLFNTGNRFNLLGNPYPSYLNSVTFLENEAAISDTQTLWVWNQTLETNGSYEVKIVGDAFIIAPGQGFFVQANATGATTFNFSEANQSHNATDTFQKSQKTQIKLDISDGDIENYCKIYYSPETTSGFDVGYDGELFSGAPNPFAIYTHLVSDSEGKHYQIQSLPYSDIENMVIPVGINAASGKEISITADVKNFPAGVHLYLEDKLENSFTQLSKSDAKYTVTLSDNLEGIGRFFLRASSSDLNNFSTSLENISVYTSSKNNLRIVGIQDGNVKLRAYNILGAEIVNTSFEGNGKNDVAIPSLAAGIYIIHLEMATGKVSRKVVVE